MYFSLFRIPSKQVTCILLEEPHIVSAFPFLSEGSVFWYLFIFLCMYDSYASKMSSWAAACLTSKAADTSANHASVSLHLVQPKFRWTSVPKSMEEENHVLCWQKRLCGFSYTSVSASASWGDVSELEEFNLLAIPCVLTSELCWCGTIHRGSTLKLGCQCRYAPVMVSVMLTVLCNYSFCQWNVKNITVYQLLLNFHYTDQFSGKTADVIILWVL